ncbi:hypothetical protein MHU86_9671 (mitochondrion) [Fragilaria crotonensis]|nr:hypothetical protein MHU86_9671 [Fragilaria crotonensis]
MKISVFFCKLHLKLCYFYLMDTTSLYCFRQNLQLKSLETNVRIVRFCCFYENNTISIEFETQITLFVKPF